MKIQITAAAVEIVPLIHKNKIKTMAAAVKPENHPVAISCL